MTVNGVRSSCEAMLMKSDFALVDALQFLIVLFQCAARLT
jgi:hypothetical protein